MEHLSRGRALLPPASSTEGRERRRHGEMDAWLLETETSGKRSQMSQCVKEEDVHIMMPVRKRVEKSLEVG